MSNLDHLKRFYSIEEVSHVTSISKSHIRKLVRDGEFPKPVKLGRQKTVWTIESVNQWIESRISLTEVA